MLNWPSQDLLPWLRLKERVPPGAPSLKAIAGLSISGVPLPVKSGDKVTCCEQFVHSRTHVGDGLKNTQPTLLTFIVSFVLILRLYSQRWPKLLIFLPPLSGCWDYRCAPPHVMWLGLEPGTLWMLDRLSRNWATVPLLSCDSFFFHKMLKVVGSGTPLTITCSLEQREEWGKPHGD